MADVAKNNQKLYHWLDGSMLGETACDKRVEAWAARQFRDVRGSVETHRFDQKTQVVFKRCARSC